MEAINALSEEEKNIVQAAGKLLYNAGLTISSIESDDIAKTTSATVQNIINAGENHVTADIIKSKSTRYNSR